MPKCKFCNKDIIWVKEGRKNRPLNEDGTLHQCDELKNTLKSTKKIKPTELSPEEIARYEQGINEKASGSNRK